MHELGRQQHEIDQGRVGEARRVKSERIVMQQQQQQQQQQRQ
jgi:hypothetical protein